MKINVKKSKIYSYTDQPSDLYNCGLLYAGKKGYFSNLPNFADCEEGILLGMTVIAKAEGFYYPFKKGTEAISADYFKYFCPEECAVKKSEEPEFRPYKTLKTLDELPFKIGDSVTFREKGDREQSMLICAGIVVNGSQLSLIHLGAHIFEPEGLFEDYEYFNGKEWVPFGVEA